MPMFMYVGPPIYAAGQGTTAVINEALGDVVDAITASATQTPTSVVWQPVPDILFTQNQADTFDVSGLVSNVDGLPMNITLESGTLPTGVTFVDPNLVYDGLGPIDVVTGASIVLRATTGSMCTIDDTFGPIVEAMTGTATQPSTTGSIANINDVFPAIVDSISATATQNPPPEGDGYPTTYFVPSYQEYAFSDVRDAVSSHDLGATWKYTPQVRNTPTQPGFYHAEGNAPIQWNNIGGDWVDANGVNQGPAPWASQSVTDTDSEKAVNWTVTTLCQAWANGTFKNAGFFLKGSNTNALQWRSRYAATNKPTLLINGTDTIQCGRNIWLSNSGESTLAGNPQFQTSGATSYGLLWFDLSAYGPGTISSAVLTCYTYAQFGAQTVNVFRVKNPADQDNIDTQHLGLAANYPLDVGIENDPNVLFVQKFEDANYQDLWMHSLNGDGSHLITDPDGNGFTKLAGLYNGARVTQPFTTPPSNTNAAWEAHWSPWRGYGQRLKPYEEVEELYLRYYLMWGNDWDPTPDGGKMPGFDGRYCDISPGVGVPIPCLTLPGMGRGNSGSGTDGMTGWSTRCNYYRTPTVGDPLENARGLGSGDMYHADMTGPFGGGFGWNKHYLGHMRKGQWNCIDFYTKLNTVSDPTQIPRRIDSITQSGGVATVTLTNPETDPAYVVGATWQFGGIATSPTAAYNNYQYSHVITSIIDSRHFTFTVPASTPSPATPGTGPTLLVYMCCTPSVGNFDGIVRGWVNGRLAGEFTNIRFRHCAKRFDGGLHGIDNVWFASYQGGGSYPDKAYTKYFSNIVVAKNYIGPMVGYP